MQYSRGLVRGHLWIHWILRTMDQKWFLVGLPGLAFVYVITLEMGKETGHSICGTRRYVLACGSPVQCVCTE